MKTQKEELDEFLYIVSHDFQEPLRHICAYTEILNEILNNENHEVQSCMNKITEGCHRLREMLLGILQLSRINRETLKRSQVCLETVFKEALMRVGEKGEKVTVDGTLPIVENVDEKLISLLFYHLISNSLKFRKKGKGVKISLRFLEEDDHWEIEFRDNGIGVEKEYYGKIFHVFQKLHSSKEYPGLGLGLSICQRIIHEHGGTIRIHSKPNQGTSIYFTLPKS